MKTELKSPKISVEESLKMILEKFEKIEKMLERALREIKEQAEKNQRKI